MRVVLATLVAAAALLAGAGAAATPRFDDWCVTKTERRGVVWLRTSDRKRVAGVLIGPRTSRRGVVIAHENGGGLCNWLPYGRRLARRGYRVLALDLRGFASSPQPRTNPYRYDLDVAAAVRELRRRGVRRVGLIGGSLGSTTVLVASARIAPPVDAVIAASGPTSFRGLDAEPAVASTRIPVLFIAAADDSGFADAARTLHARSVAPAKELTIVAGIDHGYQLVSGAANEPNRALFERFLGQHLGG
jgi:dienelactone hydrolase